MKQQLSQGQKLQGSGAMTAVTAAAQVVTAAAGAAPTTLAAPAPSPEARRENDGRSKSCLYSQGA